MKVPEPQKSKFILLCRDITELKQKGEFLLMYRFGEKEQAAYLRHHITEGILAVVV